MQPRKGRVEVTKIECKKNDGHSSIKHAGWESLSAKAASKSSNLSDETFKQSSSPAVVKDHRSKDLQFRMDAPVLTYSKKPDRLCSRSKCPPLNAIYEDASMFPLNTTHNFLQMTQKISSEKMKVEVGGDSSDIVHQNFEGRCVPVKNSPTSGMLFHNKISSKKWHNDKSCDYRGLDAILPGYKSSLKDSASIKVSENCGIKDVISPAYKPSMKDSLVGLWPGVMDHHTLTEAMSRAKSRRAISDTKPVRNMVNDVSRNFNRIPCQKRKVTDLSNSSNPIPYCPRKIAPKKALIEQPVLQSKSSCPFPKNVKLTFKQKQQVPEKTNMKVRFLLKQEHEAIKSNAQVTKDTLDHSRTAASLTCNQPI
ncbi:uncharacterized protein LOC110701287 [Chenopodium quinoa]|nr:uncharacterized protein LOC110701287 [Chenopodium quinoa]